MTCKKTEKSSLEIVASLIHENIVGTDITRRIVVPYGQRISGERHPHKVLHESTYLHQQNMRQGHQDGEAMSKSMDILDPPRKLLDRSKIDSNHHPKQPSPTVIDLTEIPRSIDRDSLGTGTALSSPQRQQHEHLGSIKPSLSASSEALRNNDTSTEREKVPKQGRHVIEGGRSQAAGTMNSYVPGRSLFSSTEQNSSYSSATQDPTGRIWDLYLDNCQPLAENKSSDLDAERRNLPPLRLHPCKFTQRPAHETNVEQGIDEKQQRAKDFLRFAYDGGHTKVCDGSRDHGRNKVRKASGRQGEVMYSLFCVIITMYIIAASAIETVFCLWLFL